jgi:two-component system, NarL family, nitrate/nitrite response regulator NarL
MTLRVELSPGEVDVDGLEHIGDWNFYPRVAGSSTRALLIIDDSRLRRDCLKAALSQRLAGWRFDEAETARDLTDDDVERPYDAILFAGVRIDSDDVSQLSALAPVLVCCDGAERCRAQRLLDAGARGLVPQSLGLGALLAAIERVRAGGYFVPVMPNEPDPPVRQELTRRQREVLALITEGKSNKLIADALAMSQDTVKAHVKQIIKRLNVANRTQAALLATGAGPAAARWEAAGR